MMVFLETFRYPLKLKIKLCGFEQCLVAHDEFVMTWPTSGLLGVNTLNTNSSGKF